MTGPTESEPMDGGFDVDPAIVKALLRYREAVAVATEQCCLELREAGIEDPTSMILGRPDKWQLRRRR